MKTSSMLVALATALLSACLGASDTPENDDPSAPEGEAEALAVAGAQAALRFDDPCSRVRCRAGTHCEAIGRRVACIPDAPLPECTTDADCRVVASYCGGCNCLPLGPGESAPICDKGDVVACFVDPCLHHEARCLEGQCVDGSTF